MRVHLILIFVALLWGLNPPVMKIGLPYIDPLSYNAVRMAAALAVGWPVFKRLSRWQPLFKKDLCPLFTASLGFFFFQVFFTYGVQTTTAGNASLVLGCLPISVAVINHLHKFEHIKKRMIISIFVSLSGVAVMVAGTGGEVSFTGVHMLGALMLLAAQFSYGYYTVFSRILASKYSAYQASAYILLISNILFVLISLPDLLAVDWQSVPQAAWGSMLYSGLFPLCLGNVLWIWGVKILGSTKSSLYNNLPPVFSIIAGYLFLQEPFGLLQLAGATVIFAGLYIAKGAKDSPPASQSQSQSQA